MELYIVLCVIVLAMVYVAYNYFKIKKMDEGTAEMAEMAGIIRSGAAEFLKTEFKTITIVVLLVAVYALYRKDQRDNLRNGQPYEQRGMHTGHEQRHLCQRPHCQ